MTPQIIDNFTVVRGRHTIKAGFDISLHKISSYPFSPGMGTGMTNQGAFGRFSFTGKYTLGKAGTAQPGHAFADFLLGYPVGAYRSSSTPNMVSTSPRSSFYVQDDWQVSRRLTLNLGMRYMYQAPWRERNNTISNFDFKTGRLIVQSDTLPSQAQQRLMDDYPIYMAKDVGMPVDDLQPDRNNFSPRVGLAYRPFANNKTVVRAGFGVYYNFLPYFIGFRQRGYNNAPFVLSESFEAAASYTPSITLANPFPGNGAISANASLTAVQKDIKNSESYQWNFTLEREIRSNLGVRASYVGNHSTHVPWYNYSINVSKEQIPGAYQPYRPFQPWSDILLLAGGGNSILHQLQLEAVQRYSNGLNFQVEYSWNRSLDDVPVSGGPQDPYNARADRGNSDQIRRHIWTFAGSYELPFGAGKKFFSGAHPVVKHIVGGWQLSSIMYLRSGTPFSPGFSITQTGWRGSRPNVVAGANLYLAERTLDQWFNPAAFSVPAPFTWGNAQRNMLFTPGEIVADASLLKDFRFYERLKMQVRAEFFNFPNHPNWGGPGTNISTSSTIGKITSRGGSREVQFGLKILF